MTLVSVSVCSAQITNADSLLAGGKRAFKAAEQLRYSAVADLNPDTVAHLYQTAESLFVQALHLAPDNSEAHYFLGYCLQRMASVRAGADYLVENTRETVTRVSDELQKAVAVDRRYRGEVVILGPYGKITSEWGSLAQAYALRGYPDSARWAFLEGRRRGGFSDPLLEYGRNILGSCPKDAILMVGGDLDTFPLWYVQCVDGYRRDVTIANLSLCNASWYVRHLRRSYTFGTANLPATYSDVELDSLAPVWSEGNMTVEIPLSKRAAARLGITDRATLRRGVVELTAQPRHANDVTYLAAQDLILLDVVKANAWERSVCISTSVHLEDWIGLAPYVRLRGMVVQLMPTRQPYESMRGMMALDYDAMRATLLGVTSPSTAASDRPPRLGFAAIMDTTIVFDERDLTLQHYRRLYYELADGELNLRHDSPAAVGVLNEMERLLPRRIAPMHVELAALVSDLYMKAGDSAAGMVHAREAIAVIDAADPDSMRGASPGFDSRRTRALLLVHLGRYDDAIIAYRALLAESPDDWTLRLAADRVSVQRLLAMRDTAGAVARLRELIDDAVQTESAGGRYSVDVLSQWLDELRQPRARSKRRIEVDLRR